MFLHDEIINSAVQDEFRDDFRAYAFDQAIDLDIWTDDVWMMYFAA